MCSTDTRGMASPTKRSSMQRALRARDDGLRKVSRVTRGLVAGAVVATGLFTTLAAWAQPGHTKAAGVAGQGQAAVPNSNATANGGNGTGGGVDSSLSPPAAVPTPGYQYSSPVVSGAS